MLDFKAVLKEAIKTKALKIDFQANQKPRLLHDKDLVRAAEAKATSNEQIQEYFNNLFPKDLDRIANEVPTKGTLNIVQFGDIKLIAEPKLHKLMAFLPPEGEKLYRDTWAEIAASHQAVPTPPPLNLERGQPPAVVNIKEQPPTPPASDGIMAKPIDSTTSTGPEDDEPLTPIGLSDLSDLGTRISSQPPRNDEIELETNDMFSLGILEQGLAASPASATSHPTNEITLAFDSELLSSALNDADNPLDTVVGRDTTSQTSVLAESEFALEPQEVSVTGEWQNSEPATQEFRPDIALAGLTTNADMPFDPQVNEEDVSLASSKPEPIHSTSATEFNTDDEICFTASMPEHSTPAGDYLINGVLKNLIDAGGSDLHLTTGQPITMRVDGDIIRTSEQLSPEAMKSLLLPIMPAVNRSEFLATNDTDFSYEVENIGRFRVNIFRDRNGVGAVMRQIPTEVPTADSLALAPAIRKFCTLSKGLVLVTGPTGSGKSTTLAAMLDLINETRAEHILTIEDPIEFVHQQKSCLINQREVGSHTNSFSKALRAALREDPDIVLIGEMRDLETVSIAIETAETGHLVLGTLHTTTAVSTVDRIIDQFPEAQQNQVRMMLANSLRGIVSQVLLKKKAGGRVAAQEILVVSKSISALIRDAKVHMIPNDMQTKKAEGNITMTESLLQLVKQGIVDPNEALKKATDPEEFKAFMQSRGIAV